MTAFPNLTNDVLRQMSKQEVIRMLSGARENDPIIGTTRIENVSSIHFHAIVRQHNAKIAHALNHIPKSWNEFLWKIKQLAIPTYADFQRILDDTDQKKRVPVDVRKTRDFFSYRKWVLNTKPLNDLFLPIAKKPIPVALPMKEKARHCYVTGASGSGKSETIKLWILREKTETSPESKAVVINKNRSIVLIDPHGDLADQLARERIYYDDFQRQHQNGSNIFDLILIDPLLKADGNIFPILNPFDITGKNYTRFQIDKLAQQLVSAFTSILQNDAGLSLNMSTLLHPCIVVLLNRTGSTLLDIIRLLSNDPELIALGRQSPNPAHRLFFRERFHDPSLKRTKDAIIVKIQSLANSETFVNVLCQPRSTIDLESAVNSGASILIKCAKGKLGNEVASAFGKFVIASLLSIAFNRAEKKGKRIPINLYIDECHNFIFPAISTILTEARKYGLHLTLAQQVVGQGMDPEMTRIILGNSAVKAIGNAGVSSLSTMAKEMGVPVDYFQDLGVGNFVIKCGRYPATRMRMDASHVGGKTSMTPSEWYELRDAIVQANYAFRRQPAETSDEQLPEDIAADSVPIRESDNPVNPLPDVAHFDL